MNSKNALMCSQNVVFFARRLCDVKHKYFIIKLFFKKTCKANQPRYTPWWRLGGEEV
jgi:hypothetical protein